MRTIADFVPEAQDRKLPLLARLRRVFDGIDGVAAPGRAHPCGPELEGSGAAGEGRPAADDADRAAVRRLLCALEDYRWSAPPEEREVARQLYHLLGRWQRRVDAWPPAERRVHYRALGAALVGALPDQIERLRAAATAGPVTIDDLPADLRRRWIALDGRLRIEILPAEALLTTESIRRFVDGVRARIPDATGSAVSELETGRVAVRAFRSALAWAGLATVILLLALLRDLRAVALVTGPLLLAAVWTAAATVWLDLPFNFANVIALPLLLGVGVDNGVHMVHQARFGPAGSRDPMASSTSRAVLFATLTTIASFGNLAFATHVGMASMGRLLTVGMLCVLLATLILLPALMGDAEVGGVGGR